MSAPEALRTSLPDDAAVVPHREERVAARRGHQALRRLSGGESSWGR
ncbi:hypothetical protein [Actinomyces wuliandei]|nr:hypothetical protein [Actinomyces wuliandei]